MSRKPRATTGQRAEVSTLRWRLDIRKTGVVKNGDVVSAASTRQVVKNKVAPPFREPSSFESCTARGGNWPCECRPGIGVGADRNRDPSIRGRVTNSARSRQGLRVLAEHPRSPENSSQSGSKPARAKDRPLGTAAPTTHVALRRPGLMMGALRPSDEPGGLCGRSREDPIQILRSFE